MKVLIISHMYPSSTHPVYGTFVHEQVKELIRQGCEVRVISPIKSTPFPINLLNEKWREFSEIPKTDVRDGVKIYHPRYLSLPRNILFERNGDHMYKGIKHLVNEVKQDFDFDVIHAHVALPDGVAANLVSKDLGVPYVVTIHGEDFFKSIHLNDKAKSLIENTMNQAAKVILVSERLNKINQTHLQVPDEKIKVIHNGINELFLERCENAKTYFPPGKTRILSVCHLVVRKGIEFNLRALSKLGHRNFHYIIAGDGPERDALTQLTKELDLEGNVEFLGAVKPEVVKELMEESEVFSLPSWNEAFGVVYIEAMASGNAVIGCIGEGVEEIITVNEEGLLVPSKETDTLTEAFEYLIENPAIRTQMGMRAVNKVNDQFTWKKNVSEIINVYEGLPNVKVI
ncbi:glycosyltransferase [Bacillus sp. KH172YL63]|uniref:glycosyltransferase n=1 Tax=Bacillus sp. KH172YL63 TaxID=2709784 RepID=UPI0013E4ACB7|nr:glycosyltransferase [Bacillus sp. KH172YL63]BCB05760.1 glycosyl transferase [Bacillus sp. KH172YL63]